MSAVAQIPVSSNNVNELPESAVFQKVLLIGSTITSILSLIPCIRYSASIVLRSTSLISASGVFLGEARSDSCLTRAFKIMKIAAIALGIIAIAAEAPNVLATALIIDIAFQAFQLIKACQYIDPMDPTKLLGHVFMLIVNTLTIAGILAASWECMVAAASINIVAMTFFAIHAGINAKHGADFIDLACYVIQAALGIATAISISEITTGFKSKVNIDNRNENTTAIVRDNYGNTLASVKPGETLSLECPYTAFRNIYGRRALEIIHKDAMGNTVGPVLYSYRVMVPITRPALEASKFPQVPVSGLILGTQAETGSSKPLNRASPANR